MFIVSDRKSYVVVISGAHLQTTRAFWTGPPVPITNDVFKSITAAPLASRPSDVALHRIMFGEIVP